MGTMSFISVGKGYIGRRKLGLGLLLFPMHLLLNFPSLTRDVDVDFKFLEIILEIFFFFVKVASLRRKV